jgi:mannose-6-phosphate isomerase-like protein (cupin superfamily)
MSYPDPAYLGDGDRGTAVLRRHGAPPDLVTATGDVGYLATGATTDGAFGLYRWNMGPEPSGPSPHFHRAMTESFFVLSGSVRLFDGRSWTDATSGDFLHVPVGGVHAFRNESGEAAAMLILFTPGAPREAYFEALGEMAASGRRVSEQERLEFLRSHDQYEA